MLIAAPEPSVLLRRDMRKTLRARRRWWWSVVNIIVILALGAMLSMGVKAFALRSFFIPTTSMTPTLLVGDRIAVDKLTPAFSGYERGDIVVFADPGNWLSPQGYEPSLMQTVGLAPDAGGYLIKRLIGLPGDHVSGDATGLTSVNGEVLTESYTASAPQEPFDVVLGDDEFWVMGDNRGNSADSRYNGPVPASTLEGRAFWVYAPFESFGPA